MPKWKKTAAALLAVFSLFGSGCAAIPDSGEAAATDRPGSTPAQYRVLTATDLHYLAPSLTDHGALFWQVMEAGDGKVTEYCDEITSAFLEEAAALQPDALILTGDLTFNGEEASHLALAEKLAAAEAAGVPVFVLPGNHDLYRKCYSFLGESSEQVASILADEFRQIYAAFGYDEALALDADSLSYTAQLNESTRLLMLDANTPHDFCSLSGKTLAWAEEQLLAAEEAGQHVLVCCHQNLLKHSMFGTGYVLGCAEQLRALLEKYHVPLFLSGHLHIQHICAEGTVTEIATSPLTMAACQYGRLQLEDGVLTYDAEKVPVADWAARNGLKDENLLDFENYAIGRLETRTRVQAEGQLQKLGFPEEEILPLADFACALNNGYFTGDLTLIPGLDSNGSLLRQWKESGAFFASYFASIENEIGMDHTFWQQELS